MRVASLTNNARTTMLGMKAAMISTLVAPPYVEPLDEPALVRM